VNTLQDDQIAGSDALSLLNNPSFKRAIIKVNEALDLKALSCDPDNQKMAARIVLSKQLLASIEKELVKVVANANHATIKIKEIEESRTVKQKILRR
jgi:hypothetical protein